MKCAIITPVGPGHQNHYQECAASIRRAQEFSAGPFDEIIPISIDDAAGMGRSRARNIGIATAKERNVDWLFFIDADDVLVENTFAVVEEYVDKYDAIWGLIFEQRDLNGAPAIRKPQIQSMNNLMELLAYDPYQTLQMGHFVRTSKLESIHFNEELDFGEDFDYYLRLWSSASCIKIPQALFLNRIGNSAQGPRSGDGLQWRPHVHKIIRKFATDHSLQRSIHLHQKTCKFLTPMPYDNIQTHLLAGKYFETDELEYLRETLSPGLAMADIGAHVGNHTIYLQQYLQPNSLVAIECNPEAIGLLKNNIALNNMQEINQSYLGIAVGRKNFRASLISPDIRNTDRTKLTPDPEGAIEVKTFDSLSCGPLNFIKIDVEGMELGVLAGAANTINDYRPDILIDINSLQLSEFNTWLKNNKYAIRKSFAYPGHANYHISPTPE